MKLCETTDARRRKNGAHVSRLCGHQINGAEALVVEEERRRVKHEEE